MWDVRTTQIHAVGWVSKEINNRISGCTTILCAPLSDLVDQPVVPKNLQDYTEVSTWAERCKHLQRWLTLLFGNVVMIGAERFIASMIFHCLGFCCALLSRGTDSDWDWSWQVMKSKDEVVMHAGFRRFSARPIYSEIPRTADDGCQSAPAVKLFIKLQSSSGVVHVC
jgi:hypothetical protein